MIAGARQSAQWHNALPAWIRGDPQYQKLPQGPRHTLQAIANRCDARGAGDGDRDPLLACFAGDSLIEECGCASSTFWRHINLLEDRGWLVCLSRGGGRLANVLAIPGQRGQLDPYRASRGQRQGTGAGGIWTREDTDRVRRLVSHNETLVNHDLLVSQNESAPLSKSDGTPSIMRGQPSQNERLPSHTPSDHQPNTKADVVGGGLNKGNDDPARSDETRQEVIDALTSVDISEPTRSRLAALPGIDAQLVRDVASRTQSSGGGTGAVIRAIETEVQAKGARNRVDEKRRQEGIRLAEEQVQSREDTARQREANEKEQCQVDQFINSMDDHFLEREKQAVLGEMEPTSRRFFEDKDPRRDRMLKAKIHERNSQIIQKNDDSFMDKHSAFDIIG